MPHFMTLGECAELLRVTRRTVARYVTDYGLPHSRFAGVIRFERDAVLAWTKEFKPRNAKSHPVGAETDYNYRASSRAHENTNRG